jgi:Na+-translocating ferredoxin:NAD+ oxidoreductase subunit B
MKSIEAQNINDDMQPVVSSDAADRPKDIPIGIVNPIKFALAQSFQQDAPNIQGFENPENSKNHPHQQIASPQAEKLVDDILAVLPQTQCTKCGYSGCLAYAKAIAQNSANYNQCPPGGAEGVARLAKVLNQPILPLNDTHGIERVRRVAVINASQCIGCTLCIQACPTDAIIGSSKYLHAVLNDWCTGCDLCVNPCPVDCIEMLEIPELAAQQKTAWAGWSQNQANQAKNRFEQKIERKKSEQLKNTDRMTQKQAEKKAILAENTEEQQKAAQKKAMIQAAIERAKQRLAQN